MSAKHDTVEHQTARLMVCGPAKLDPGYRCPYPACGLTLAELRAEDPRVHWQACHPSPDVSDDVPAYRWRQWFAGCSRCNAREGARVGNRLRAPRTIGW